MCAGVPEYMYMSRICKGIFRVQKGAFYPLELESQPIVSLHADAGNQTWFLCKASSSPALYKLFLLWYFETSLDWLVSEGTRMP